jgi:hypothetical protein
MKATLDTPLTLDPQQAVDVDIVSTQIDHKARVLIVTFDLLDSNGNAIARRTATAGGAQVQTWIGNQETTIYQRLLAKLGLTGTIG